MLLLQIQTFVRENKWEMLLGLGIGALVIFGTVYLVTSRGLVLVMGVEGLKIGKYVEIAKAIVQIGPIAALGFTSSK